MHDYPVHPVAALFPLIEGPEFAALVDDIRRGGLRHPCVLWKDGDGKTWLIDGRNRQRACKAAGVEARYETWHGDTSVVSYIVSVNIPRRHLTTSQRALIAAELVPYFQEEARRRMNSGTLASIDARGKAADQAGRAMNVSGSSVDRAAKVKGDYLIDKVKSGKVSVSRAASLADLPPEEQARLVNEAEDRARQRRAADDVAECRAKPTKKLTQAAALAGELGEAECAYHVGAALRALEESP